MFVFANASCQTDLTNRMAIPNKRVNKIKLLAIYTYTCKHYSREKRWKRKKLFLPLLCSTIIIGSKIVRNMEYMQVEKAHTDRECWNPSEENDINIFYPFLLLLLFSVFPCSFFSYKLVQLFTQCFRFTSFAKR